MFFFFFQAEDGIRDRSPSRGLGDVYKRQDIPSVTYEYYQNHIKPKPQAVGKTEDGQTIWRCRICGYEYVGEELPDDFVCPLCKHPASDFEKVIKKAEVRKDVKYVI